MKHRLKLPTFFRTALSTGVTRNTAIFTVLMLSSTLVGLAGTTLFNRKLLNQQIYLSVDANISEGSAIAAYLNGDYTQELRQPLAPGIRKVYQLGPFQAFENVRMIRLDPTNAVRAGVEIHEIALTRAGHPKVKIDFSKAQEWDLINAKVHFQSAQSSLSVQPLSDDPYLFIKAVPPVFSAGETILPRWVAEGTYVKFALAAFALILLLGSAKNPLFPVISIILAGTNFYLAQFLAQRWLTRAGSTLPVSQSLGFASYDGYPKKQELLFFAACFSISLLMGAVAGLAAKRLRKVSAPVLEKASPRFSWTFLVVLLAGFAILEVPGFHDAVGWLNGARHALDYDSMNILTWQYMVQKGWMPFRDFWYPYAGNFNEIGPFPGDMFRRYVTLLITFAVFATSTYVILRKDIPRTLMVLAGIGALAGSSYLQSVSRYFMALNGVLFFLAVQRLDKRRTLWHAGLGLYLGYVFVYEGNQALYAVAAIVGQAALYWLFPPSGRARAELMKEALAAAGTFLISLVLYISVLYFRGQFPGFLAFYADASEMANYGAISTPLLSWYQAQNPALEHWLLLLIHLFGAFGAFLYLSGKASRIADVLFSIALLAAAVFSKQIIRPHIALQFAGYLFTAALLTAALWSFQWTALQRKFACLLLPAGAILVLSGDWLGKVADHYLYRLHSLPRNFSKLMISEAEIQASIRNYFSPKTFVASGSTGQDYVDQLKARFHGREVPEFYVLGDESFLYMLFDRKPPYYITFYNGCHRNGQLQTIDWLERNKTELVIWNPNFKRFDDVPNAVRMAMLMNYVVRHYKPAGKLGSLDLLTRLQPGEPLDLTYWREAIGGETDLRMLPALSSGATAPACDSTDPGKCSEFLEVNVPSGAHPADRPVSLGFEAQGLPFTVSFKLKAGQENYHIFLNRLWFWTGPETIRLTSRPEGISTQTVLKHPDPGFLY